MRLGVTLAPLSVGVLQVVILASVVLHISNAKHLAEHTPLDRAELDQDLHMLTYDQHATDETKINQGFASKSNQVDLFNQSEHNHKLASVDLGVEPSKTATTTTNPDLSANNVIKAKSAHKQHHSLSARFARRRRDGAIEQQDRQQDHQVSASSLSHATSVTHDVAIRGIDDNNNNNNNNNNIMANVTTSTVAAVATSGLVDSSNQSQTVLELSAFEAAQMGFYRHTPLVSVILTVAYTIVFIIGIVGNSLVVAIVCKSPRMRTVTNYFIANLALADILVLVFCLPVTLVGNLFIPYVLGQFVCKTVSYLQGVAVSASINTMVTVTMDRFLAICFPMDWHMRRRTARRTIACIWLFGMTISLPWALFFTLVPYPLDRVTIQVCAEEWPNEQMGKIYFVCANLILLYLFPAFVIIICYLGIWYKIERRNIPGDGAKGLKIELIMQRSKLKVVKMMMLVVVIFLLSWLPLYLIFARVKLADERHAWEDWLIATLLPLAQWLGASNSCINPILYTFFNKKYKRGFVDLLRSVFCCGRSPESTDLTSVIPNGHQGRANGFASAESNSHYRNHNGYSSTSSKMMSHQHNGNNNHHHQHNGASQYQFDNKRMSYEKTIKHHSFNVDESNQQHGNNSLKDTSNTLTNESASGACQWRASRERITEMDGSSADLGTNSASSVPAIDSKQRQQRNQQLPSGLNDKSQLKRAPLIEKVALDDRSLFRRSDNEPSGDVGAGSSQVSTLEPVVAMVDSRELIPLRGQRAHTFSCEHEQSSLHDCRDEPGANRQCHPNRHGHNCHQHNDQVLDNNNRRHRHHHHHHHHRRRRRTHSHQPQDEDNSNQQQHQCHKHHSRRRQPEDGRHPIAQAHQNLSCSSSEPRLNQQQQQSAAAGKSGARELATAAQTVSRLDGDAIDKPSGQRRNSKISVSFVQLAPTTSDSQTGCKPHNKPSDDRATSSLMKD